MTVDASEALNNLEYLELPGLKDNFLIHLQSFDSEMFFTGKLVRPPANSFQMFGRNEWF